MTNIITMSQCKSGNHKDCPAMNSSGEVCNCSCHNKQSVDKFMNSADQYFNEQKSKFKSGNPTLLSESVTEGQEENG